jgi:2-hydroxy-3-keto-5-methylthiopentenyl-1-phosphate phosphatase
VNKYAIITDFDGTVTTRDIGNTLALRAGSITLQGIEEDYKQNKDAKEWMAYHFGRMNFSKEEFEELVLSFAKIRPGFDELAGYAKQNAIPFEIASGGLDIYISPVLKRGNIKDIIVYSMRGVFDGRKIKVDFPHFADLTLEDFKKSRVDFYKQKGYKVIFAGDGPSDFPAAKSAGIVFAADKLAKLCKTNKIKFFELKDFKPVLEILKKPI